MRVLVLLLLEAITFGQVSQHVSDGARGRNRPQILEFLHELQKCVAEENRACVASMVEYPVGLSRDGKKSDHEALIVMTPAELIRHFDEVFSPPVRKVLSDSSAKPALKWGQVYVLGDDHQIWLERTKNDGFKVTAVGVAKYHAAGIENTLAAESFFRDLQAAVKVSDKHEVSSMVDYPITVNLAGRRVKLTNAQQLVRSYESVFNAKVRRAVTNQNPSLLRANWRGLIVGDGELWFTQEADSDAFKITAINP
jgi:hypothetical protein